MDALEVLTGIYVACGGGDTSPREKLDFIQLAWLCVASNARTEALIDPGGFPAERERQVAQLRKMADIVSVDEPDLEMERLCREGDFAAMARRVKELSGGRSE